MRYALILLLFVGLASLAEAATLISRQERADGVHVVYLAEGDQQPVVQVEAGTITGYTAVQDGTAWRATVSATLERCSGVLRIDGRAVVRQRCVYLPGVVR